MRRKNRKVAAAVAVLVFCLLAAGGMAGWMLYEKKTDTSNSNLRQALIKVDSVGKLQPAYDLIVAGTDPEGIVAALSAARNGLSVLLVDGRDRDILGGLMTIGWLNSLDLNYSPEQSKLSDKHQFLNKGIFQEWYDQIEGTSFDTHTAANVFYRMVLAEPNIDLLMKVRSMEPIVLTSGEAKRITGLNIVTGEGEAKQVGAAAVIDATQDGDIAAAAGVPYTIGRADIGRPDAQMAVTLVFRLSGVTQEVWDSFATIGDGTGIDKMSAWGFKAARDYVSSNPDRVGIRALNVGRENDETVLINAMHIFDIDPLDPASVQEALEIGSEEAPLITEYLRKTYKQLENVEFAGTAPELYVRETRHMQGEYRLTAVDVVDNRDFWDAIAYGSYKVDIQRINAVDRGAIIVAPKQYGVPFRSLVPLEVDQLLVVGRAASFDSIPHGSARVIPLGMATGQAAGVAAKLAAERGMTFRELSKSEEAIGELRGRLTEQGMDLTRASFKEPDYMKHKHYKGLLAAVSMLLTFGGDYNEAFQLDAGAMAGHFSNSMMMVKTIHPDFFKGNPYAALEGLEEPGQLPLTLDQLAYGAAVTAGVEVSRDSALDELKKRGWLAAETIETIADPNKLTNGETFSLVRDIVQHYVGVVYE
ncbi:FAD-dependent oxidoreductase [Paenibacillus sp. 1011MAR3C5]|uniref:FAD-dependent oxidoreductase n=1 Tax=Paenibacillus sp. 1011MAR3C5 TaxID=1675787 RepID=UPI000E6BC1AA|nr:FAD-dependent oxidoreductase [Paenibacillus sp. 1011MAR3C5]RJE88506.1 FAD-dependent oxidoreductase [Paenibacillus sp. 1011MAR3C5]